jgi:glycerol-3-phosphate dehydrogenase
MARVGSATPNARSVSLGRRESQVEKLRERQFDLLVIGGGITGAGIALDAASRGLRVALIEKSDFASGTSSRSTKLIHGGLRYLAQLRFRLTREALAERTLLQQLAPHLVAPIPFLFPIYHSRIETWRVNTGLWLYDLLAGLRQTKVHRRLNLVETLARAPLLKRDGLRAGFLYYDAQTDDARLVVEVLKSAVEYGAVVANYVAAERLRQDRGRASGIVARDAIGGESFEVRAHKVVLATGVWLDETFGEQPGAPRRVRPAKGVHLIVPRNRLETETAVAFPTPDGRLMFVIPWQGATLIGTTDTDYPGPLDEPRADRADLDYLLGVVNAAFPGAHLTDDDVISVQAGLRPLIDDGDGNTASLSREDRVFENRDGTIGIAGGKLTTYRRMGRKVVDLVVRRLKEEGWLRKKPRSVTRSLPLGGFPLRQRRRFSRLGRFIRRRRVPSPVPALAPISPETARRFYASYGANWQVVAELIRERPELGEPVIPGLDVVKAEIVFAVRDEMARTLLDVLARRTHVALLDRNQARDVAPAVAEIVGHELGWDADEQRRQVERYNRQVDQFSVEPLRGVLSDVR